MCLQSLHLTVLYCAVLPLLPGNQLFQHHLLNNPSLLPITEVFRTPSSFILLYEFLYQLYTVLVTRVLLYSVILSCTSVFHCFSTKFPSYSQTFFFQNSKSKKKNYTQANKNTYRHFVLDFVKFID